MNDGSEKPRSPHVWAVLATIGLVSSVAVEAITIVLILFARHLVPDWEALAERGETVGLLFAVGLSGGVALSLTASITGVLSFLVWLARAIRFAHSRGRPPNSSPFGAVVGWFIPFVCWLRPYNVVRSLHRVSVFDNPNATIDLVARWPRIFPVWWFAWLATILLRKFSALRSWDAPPVLTVEWVDLAELPCAAVAAACLTTILWSIQGAQTALATEHPAPHFLPPEDPSDDDVDDDG